MRTRLTLIALISLLPAAAAEKETPWRAGFAAVRITPPEPVPLAGFADRVLPYQGVDSDLFAKALALDDGQGHRALLITADLCVFSRTIVERACERITGRTGLPREAILLNASHTHTGPVVAAEMGHPPEGESLRRVNAYLEALPEKLAGIAAQALSAMRPAALSFGQGMAPFVVNRRQVTERGIVLGLNPRGPADRTVPVLRIDGPGGELRGLVFGAAGHNVTLRASLRVDADYAGYAQAEIERRYPGAQAMFVMGCGGDATVHPKGTRELAQAHGRALAEEALRVSDSGMKAVRGPLRAGFRRIDLPLRRFTPEQLKEFRPVGEQRFFVNSATAELKRGGSLPERYNAPLALWQFGEDLTLLAYSGEAVVDYAIAAEKLLGPLGLWIAAYSNDVFGYLPSKRVLSEGGYETRGIYIGYGLFDPSVEDVVLRAVEEMARSAGRKLPR